MILRSAETSIQTILQAALDEEFGLAGVVPVIISDESEIKPQMPYVAIQCLTADEIISPGCGIFKVAGDLHFRSHTKETTPGDRQAVLDAINSFAYDSTAEKLSEIEGFHCHGWHPTAGSMAVESETKSYAYSMKFWVYCMAIDN